MGFMEDEDLVEVANDLVGKGVEDVGPDEDGSCVPEAEEETHDIAEDPVGQGLNPWISGKKLLR